jgi:hypothetical protein
MQKSGKNKQLSKYFPLTLTQLEHQAKLDVFFADDIITTKNMKNVLTFFEQQLPGVLETKCFNPQSLPFRVEILKTELAHLFEHVILVLLCQAKTARGETGAVFRGETNWDWEVTPKGLFTILLSVNQKDAALLEEVLPKASELIDTFLAQGGIRPEKNPSRQAYLPTWSESGDSHFTTVV